MKKILKIIGIILIIVIIIYIIYIFTLRNYLFYSSQIEIQIPFFAKIEEKDTHGGFHGDGEAFAKIYFSKEQATEFVNKVKQNSNWKELPIPEELKDSLPEPIDNGMKIPFVENGYWFCIDRHSEANDRHNYNEMLSRSSLNYSIAVFDNDSNILYFYALDT